MHISDWRSDVCSSDLRNANYLAPDDIRHTSPRFQGDNLSRNAALLEKIQALCTRHGITGGQLALAWLLHRDQPIVPIPGTKRITYLEEDRKSTRLNSSH